MNRNDLIDKIYNLIEFIEIAHPCFYKFRTKEELNKEIDLCIIESEKYDQYDLYYYLRHIIKFMVDKYDLHTKLFFKENKYLPINIKCIDNKFYVINSINHENIEFGELISINKIKIEDLIKELEYITCYDTNEYFYTTLENNLINVNILKCLPLLKGFNDIEITVLKNENIINEKLEIDNYKKIYNRIHKPNYYYEIINDTIYFRYQCCCDIEQMNKMIDIFKNSNIKNYIIDVRSNNGGNSGVNDPLIDFISNKNTIIISDENVFSSALMFLIECKKNNIPIIGVSPSSSINSIGNLTHRKEIESTDLELAVSTKYFYYDDNYDCIGTNINNFNLYDKDIPDFLKLKYINVDKIIKLSLINYINNNDVVIKESYDILHCK